MYDKWLLKCAINWVLTCESVATLKIQFPLPPKVFSCPSLHAHPQSTTTVSLILQAFAKPFVR